MPSLTLEQLIPAALAEELSTRWHEQSQLALSFVDTEGHRRYGESLCNQSHCRQCPQISCWAVNECRRWGEPTITLCPGNWMLWAAPVMFNQQVIGGLITAVREERAFRPIGTLGSIANACTRLRELAETYNLTNASALDAQRQIYRDEQERAYALHTFKTRQATQIRELYFKEEPALFSAIRAGDRQTARQIINRILAAIHHRAGDRLETVKSFFLELVVMMCRTAVEAGGKAEQLLGDNFTIMAELARINDDQALATWLRQTLEHLMDIIARHRDPTTDVHLMDAIAWMQRHCTRRISRDDAAAAAHLSPAHFSVLITRQFGQNFTDLLNQMRIDKARELLSRTDTPIAQVAQATGFNDQSYFTKVFKKHAGDAPLKYRRKHQAKRSTRP